jgi:chitinase
VQICNSDNANYFPGTELLDCSFLASDIEMCQSAGKAVTISLGGGAGNIHFQDDSQAAAYAETIWNLFLGGKSKTRPFGSAILDGSVCFSTCSKLF